MTTSQGSSSFYLMTGLAALASALLFVAMISGSAILPLIGYFVQLPLVFAGLSLGLTSAALASVGSIAVVILATGGLLAALVYLVVQALPVLVLVRFALLSRAGPGGQTEWYPPGLLLGCLTSLVLGTSMLLLAISVMVNGPTLPLLEEILAPLLEQLVASDATVEIEQQLRNLLVIMPGMVAASWFGMIVINAVLGQWLAGRQGQAQRPAPVLRTLELPTWLAPSFGIVLALAFTTSGELRMFAATAAMVLAMPLMLQGLAVLHTLAARWKLPGIALFAFYLTLMLFIWPIGPIVLILGLVESWVHIRQRYAA